MKQTVLDKNLVIRKFKKQDAKKVKDFIVSILSKEFAIDKSAYPDTDLEHIPSSYGGKRETFLVLTLNSKLIGTVAVKEDSKHSALLRRLFISPDQRGRGYGTVLIKEAVDFCKGKSFHELVFRTTARMSGAIISCKRNGFEEKERIQFENFEIVKFVLSLK